MDNLKKPLLFQSLKYTEENVYIVPYFLYERLTGRLHVNFLLVLSADCEQLFLVNMKNYTPSTVLVNNIVEFWSVLLLSVKLKNLKMGIYIHFFFYSEVCKRYFQGINNLHYTSLSTRSW